MSSRCFKFSSAWNCRCDLEEGHEGMCNSAGDGFYGYDLRFETRDRKKIDDPKWVQEIEAEYGEVLERGKRR